MPLMKFDVDRARAGQLGFSQLDVATGLLISLSSSNQLNPNWWVNPANGVDYPVVVQTPDLPDGHARGDSQYADSFGSDAFDRRC